MANASSTSQKLQTSIKNELGVDFDVNAGNDCKMSADASQVMKNITIKGSKGVNISQLSTLQNMCYAKSVLDNQFFNKLSLQAQDDILSSAQQEPGFLPSLAVSQSTIDIQKQVESKMDLKSKIDMQKKCFAQLKAPQSMSDINIQDSLNIDLSQQSENYNKCIFDSAGTQITGQEQTTQTNTSSKSATTQKGTTLDSLVSALASGPIVLISSAIVPISIIIISSVLMMSMAPKGGDQNVGDMADEQFGEMVQQAGGGKAVKVLRWVIIGAITYLAISFLAKIFGFNRESFDTVNTINCNFNAYKHTNNVPQQVYDQRQLSFRRGCADRKCNSNSPNQPEQKTSPYPQNDFYQPCYIIPNTQHLEADYPITQIPSYMWRF